MPSQSEPSKPRISVIIPSLDGYRGGAVPKLLESVQRQSVQDYETHLIKGVAPQGKAINQGLALSRGDIIVILDDDACLADDLVFQRLLDTLETDPNVGMAGASILTPPDATPFQRWAAPQFPRFHMPVVDRITDSDYACHGCCAIPAHVFRQVGGEREDILRGLDPDLRVRLRAAGYRVVLAPGATAYHPLPDGLGAFMRIFFRNGYGSAYARKFRPETVYETHEHVDASNFQPRRSFAYRLGRFPLRLIKALAQGRLLRFAGYCAYACGYVWGTATAKETHRGPRP